MSGWYEVSKSSNGQFRFVLKAANAETILTSELYTTHAAAEQVLPAVRERAAQLVQLEATQAQRDETRRRYGLEGHVVCGYLGAFVPWHAIDRFVHQIADRLQQSPHLKLLLVGDGSTYPALRAFGQTLIEAQQEHSTREALRVLHFTRQAQSCSQH